MQMIGLARLGRDAELRTTQSGEKVAQLSLAFSYGRKGQDGKRPTQWVDASLWGKRAEAMIDYLQKGKQVVVTLDDPHIEEYQGRNGTAHKLVGTVSQIEFAGGSAGESTPAHATPPAAPRPASAQAARPAARQAPAPAPAFDPMEDDIPF